MSDREIAGYVFNRGQVAEEGKHHGQGLSRCCARARSGHARSGQTCAGDGPRLPFAVRGGGKGGRARLENEGVARTGDQYRHALRGVLVETIGVALEMGGGTAMVYGLAALDAYDQFMQAELSSDKVE